MDYIFDITFLFPFFRIESMLNFTKLSYIQISLKHLINLCDISGLLKYVKGLSKEIIFF